MRSMTKHNLQEEGHKQDREDIQIDPLKRLEMLTQITAGLLSSGHYTYSYPVDDPRTVYASHVVQDAESILLGIIIKSSKTAEK
jgi:hypothetical protein